MNPTLTNKKIVICTSLLNPKSDKVIVFIQNKKEKIKRIKSIDAEKIFIVGDNVNSSTDSRDFGAINHRQIIGRVILPRI